MKFSNSHWAVIGGLAVGGIVSVALVQNERLNAVLRTMLPTRIPMPDFAMTLPTKADEFQRLDTLACECLAQSSAATDLVQAATACMAAKLYPNFPWPHMTGDHPSVSELWQDLRIIVLRQLALGACPPRS